MSELPTWLDRAGLGLLREAGCLTLVAGADERQVLDAFGAERDTPLTPDQLLEAFIPAVAVQRISSGVLAIEVNGYQGSRPEVLKRAAAGRTASSVFWNVNAVTRLSCASSGRMRGSHELRGLSSETRLPRALLRDLLRAEENDEDMVLAGLLATARFTGLDLAEAEPTQLDFYPILSVVEDLLPIVPQYSMLGQFHETIAAQLLAAGPSTQRAVAEWAAERAITLASLAEDRRARAVLDQLGGSTPASFRPAESLLEEVTHESDRIRRTDPSGSGGPPSAAMYEAWWRVWAVRALRYATAADPVTAAFGAAEALLPILKHDENALAAGISQVVQRTQ